MGKKNSVGARPTLENGKVVFLVKLEEKKLYFFGVLSIDKCIDIIYTNSVSGNDNNK